jgi:KDO2-lipid IV(A) lauroyltransferase
MNALYRLGSFELAMSLSRILPRAVAQGVASAVGQASYFSDRQARLALRENLEVVTAKTGRKLDALCRENFTNFSRMLADYFYCSGATPAKINALLEEWRGYQNLLDARAAGKGGILVTAHLGNWELGGMLLAVRDLPMTVLTLKEPSSALTRWREEYRRRLGIKTIEVGEDKFAFVEIVKTLRRNEFVAMLIDRPYLNSGTKINFFGQETLFSSAPALLWQHTGAAVLPAFVLKNESGKYLSFVDPPVALEARSDPAEALRHNTQQIASIFEKIIRAHPSQWYNYVPIWNKSHA